MIQIAHPLVRPTSQNHWIEQLVAPDRVAPAWESALHHLTWSFIRFGIRHQHTLEIEGIENIPTEGPVVIVANHGSHLDTLLLGSVIPSSLRSRFTPLAAGDTFFKSFIQSWFSSRFLNLRPLWRRKANTHGMLRLRNALTSHNDCFLVFPEGTRSRSGSMGHFKPGIGMLVAGTDIPVVPCHIHGTHEAWPSSQKIPSKGSLKLRIGKPLTFPDHPGTGSSWRAISQQLEGEVRELGGEPLAA
ncbi:lysophospholipid acyltransferase family protein [Haloferula sp.]|uniref:lysophospholipid acyltransferase family protein n=1 Tax=Haloferula sp. TaxID=2497595 RepID=UPI003C72FEF9